MTNRLFYIAPRAKRQRRKPVRIDPKPGEAALLANVIGLAVGDYFCGNKQQSEDARQYLMSFDYQEHMQLLGLPGDMMPAAIRERIVELETND